MKAEVFNYLKIESSKRFEKMIVKALPEGVTEVELVWYSFARTGSYGHYKHELDITVDGVDISLVTVTTDSMSYDYYCDLESGTRSHSRFVKCAVLEMVEKYYDYISEKINDHKATTSDDFHDVWMVKLTD